MQYNAIPSSSTTSPRPINGYRLAARLKRGLSPTFRALLALDLEAGTVEVRNLTRKQALLPTQASGGYVSTLRRASAEVNGMSPLDDGVPDDRSTVFQTIRLIVVPFEEKPAQSFSAKQER
jgi:hypothetical protein